MKKLSEELLKYAEKDLLTIEKIIDEEYLTNIIAFHAQQCIEKSFKALIYEMTDEIPKIHNLIRLYGTVRNYIQLTLDIEVFKQINETYIDTRYPSDIGLLPEGMPSIEKAKSFYQSAKEIYTQIDKGLRKANLKV